MVIAVWLSEPRTSAVPVTGKVRPETFSSPVIVAFPLNGPLILLRKACDASTGVGLGDGLAAGLGDGLGAATDGGGGVFELHAETNKTASAASTGAPAPDRRLDMANFSLPGPSARILLPQCKPIAECSAIPGRGQPAQG